jgi:UDP-glucose 4-epimerase
MDKTAFWQRRPVLVTGGAGFIGSHLVERLVAAGGAVTVLDNFHTGVRGNLAALAGHIQIVEADVRDRRAIETQMAKGAPSVLFHLAANPSVPVSVNDPAFDFETNAAGTFNILNAARLTGSCERAVVMSSGAVYGEPDTVPIRESDPLRPISPYGASKLIAETTAAMFHRAYGLHATPGRLFNAYGPRMGRFVVRDLLHKLKQNPDRLEILGSGAQVREFTYVSDAVEGLLLLAERGEPGTAYNLSSGEPISILELARRIVAAVGLKDRTELVCTGESWAGDAQRWEVDSGRIRGLGFAPETTLESGIRSTIDWFESTEGAICPQASPSRS